MPVESPNQEHLLPQLYLRKLYRQHYMQWIHSHIHMVHYTTGKLKPARFFLAKVDDDCPYLITQVVSIHLSSVSVHVKNIDLNIKYSSRNHNLRSLVKTATTKTANRAKSTHSHIHRKIITQNPTAMQTD